MSHSKTFPGSPEFCNYLEKLTLCCSFFEQINIVDTPGTNVILQRQQRLTEEFVPRADLLLFVLSADRPLTESEVDVTVCLAC